MVDYQEELRQAEAEASAQQFDVVSKVGYGVTILAVALLAMEAARIPLPDLPTLYQYISDTEGPEVAKLLVIAVHNPVVPAFLFALSRAAGDAAEDVRDQASTTLRGIEDVAWSGFTMMGLAGLAEMTVSRLGELPLVDLPVPVVNMPELASMGWAHITLAGALGVAAMVTRRLDGTIGDAYLDS